MVMIRFSVLCHYPSFLTKECINLGILFHNVTDNIYKFEYTNNWRRIKSFNDDLDIDFLKIQLQAIKDEVTDSQNTFGKDGEIEDYIRFYVNELKFTEITSTEQDDFINFVAETKKMFFRFDYSIEDRPTKDDQAKYLRRILKEKNIESKSTSTIGYFKENLKYDLIMDNYAFKFIILEGKMPSHLISTVKSWAYNAYKLKQKYKIIFVTDIDFNSNEDFKLVYDILNEESFRIMTFSEVFPFIQQLHNEGAQKNA